MTRKSIAMVLALTLLFAFSAASALAEKPILIGAPMPLTGPYASDGEQMKMALELAVDEQNAEGGLLGRPLKIKFGDVGGLEAEKIKAVGERLLGSGVDAVITGYDDGGVDTKVFGEADVPYLHGNAMTLCTKPVAENKDKYWNVFQYTYNDKAYGVDAAEHLFTVVPEQMGWEPPNKRVGIIKVDYAYNIMPADEFAKLSKEKGYKVVVNETVPFGVAEWGPILSRIESRRPAFVTFWHLDPTDAARFIEQFAQRFKSDGYNGVVYMQYTPSIPEFLQLAGQSAEGLIWVGGKYGFGPEYEKYRERWMKKFDQPPAGMYAEATRDAFEIWVKAVEQAGCVDCYKKVADNILNIEYDGLAANYKFDPYDQSIIQSDQYMALVWNQIRDGENVKILPEEYKQGDFEKPPWMK
jgi:branched-chain amino acid transport system substrate-binding protein